MDTKTNLLRRGVAGTTDTFIEVASSTIHNIGVFECAALVPVIFVRFMTGII